MGVGTLTLTLAVAPNLTRTGGRRHAQRLSEAAPEAVKPE